MMLPTHRPRVLPPIQAVRYGAVGIAIASKKRTGEQAVNSPAASAVPHVHGRKPRRENNTF